MTMGHSELVFEADRKPTDSYQWYYINLAFHHKLLQKYMENISMMIYIYRKSATPKQVQVRNYIGFISVQVLACDA